MLTPIVLAVLVAALIVFVVTDNLVIILTTQLVLLTGLLLLMRLPGGGGSSKLIMFAIALLLASVALLSFDVHSTMAADRDRDSRHSGHTSTFEISKGLSISAIALVLLRIAGTLTLSRQAKGKVGGAISVETLNPVWKRLAAAVAAGGVASAAVAGAGGDRGGMLERQKMGSLPPYSHRMTREEMVRVFDLVPLGRIDEVAMMTFTTVGLGQIPPPPTSPNASKFTIVPKSDAAVMPSFDRAVQDPDLFLEACFPLFYKLTKGIRNTVSICDDASLEPPCLTKIPGMPEPVVDRKAIALSFEYGLQLDATSQPIERVAFTIYLTDKNYVYVGVRASENLRSVLSMQYVSTAMILAGIKEWAEDAEITVDGIMSRYPQESRMLAERLGLVE
jgi:hypothetical protein